MKTRPFLAKIASAAIATLFFLSCQTFPVRSPSGLASFIPDGADAYVLVDARNAAVLFDSMLESLGLDKTGRTELSKRTDSVLMGLYGIRSGSVSFTAAVSGNFPDGTLGWTLGANKDFEKTQNGYRTKDGKLFLTGAGPGVIVLSRGVHGHGTAFADSGDLSAPVRTNGSVSMIMFDPAMRVFPEEEPGVPMDIPVTRAVFSFSPDGAGTELKAQAIFSFEPGSKPKIYLPVVKLVAYNLFMSMGCRTFSEATVTILENEIGINGLSADSMDAARWISGSAGF